MAVNPNPMQRMAESAPERSIEDSERITHWFQSSIQTGCTLPGTTVVNRRFWRKHGASAAGNLGGSLLLSSISKQSSAGLLAWRNQEKNKCRFHWMI
jgi:hypothetical protein